jgi:hypothetical protein
VAAECTARGVNFQFDKSTATCIDLLELECLLKDQDTYEYNPVKRECVEKINIEEMEASCLEQGSFYQFDHKEATCINLKQSCLDKGEPYQFDESTNKCS